MSKSIAIDIAEGAESKCPNEGNVMCHSIVYSSTMFSILLFSIEWICRSQPFVCNLKNYLVEVEYLNISGGGYYKAVVLKLPKVATL